MIFLQVRNIPDDLYLKLSRTAKKEHRSIAQQAIIILEKGLKTYESPIEKRKQLLDEIKNNKNITKYNNLKNPLDYISEDRNR